MKKHLLHVFPSFEVGGAQSRTAAWMNRLGDEYRHTIVSIDGKWKARDLLDDAIEVDCVEAPGKASALFGRIRAYRNVIGHVAPDVLLTNNWGGIEWALANKWYCRLPHLHVESGFGVDEGQKSLRRRIWGRRLFLSRHSKIVVPSHALLRVVIDQWGFPPASAIHIPDGIDCARFAEALPGSMPNYQKQGGHLVVGTVAVLRPEKRLEVLIDAVAAACERVPVFLIIVGDGVERERLERHVKFRGLEGLVHFTGFRSDVEGIYPHFDVFGLSSVTEQMPNTVLQAMAAGLPVVATDVGDLRQMVGDAGQGWIVPPGDSSAMAARLVDLANNPEKGREIGAAYRERVQAHYDIAAMAAAYDGLLRTMTGSQVSGSGA